MDWSPIIAQVLNYLLYLVAMIVIGYVGSYFRTHEKSKSLLLLESIATEAVLFVEQAGKKAGYDNERLLGMALDYAKLLGRRYGFNLSDAEWKGLIEAQLKNLKSLWQWQEQQPTTPPPPPAMPVTAQTDAVS